MYGPMAHHYGNDVAALTPGSTEGSAHGKTFSLCFFQQTKKKKAIEISKDVDVA